MGRFRRFVEGTLVMGGLVRAGGVMLAALTIASGGALIGAGTAGGTGAATVTAGAIGGVVGTGTGTDRSRVAGLA